MGGVSTDQVDKTLSSSKRWHVAASATSLRSAQVAIQAMEIRPCFIVVKEAKMRVSILKLRHKSHRNVHES